MSRDLTPISRLLYEGRPLDAPVAIDRHGVRDFADLRGRVGALAEQIARRGPGRWLVSTENSYGCAVALLALAHTGSKAVLAPNRQPDMLRRLACDVTGAILDPGFRARELGSLPTLHPLGSAPHSNPRFARLDRGAPFVELLTSGSTGEGKPIPKALRHLEDEIEVLEENFGAACSESTRVFSTVSHQHLYGLLFRVLWPLAAGRPFRSETFLHPEELFPRMLESDSFVLATTPVHLRRMCSLDGFSHLRAGCRALFSSGSPLESDTATRVAEAVGTAPYEIFGSTETGGVAWRQQKPGGSASAWTPLARVHIEPPQADGRLVLRSPFVSVGSAVAGEDGQRFAMADRIEAHPDGSFDLLGRSDRVVKIGDKRLSLPEMEQFLERHRFVSEARLVATGHGTQTRVGAVVVATTAGRNELRSQGRRAVASALSEHLGSYWDRVLFPRSWRYVDELPRDAQGKTSRAALESILRNRSRGARTSPILYEELRDARHLQRRMEVPPDLAFLDGHFEDMPVVAGVVQVRWVMDAATVLLGAPPRVASMEALKFHSVLRPGDAFYLEVERDGDRLRFRLFDGDRMFSSGRFRLASAPESKA